VPRPRLGAALAAGWRLVQRSCTGTTFPLVPRQVVPELRSESNRYCPNTVSALLSIRELVECWGETRFPIAALIRQEPVPPLNSVGGLVVDSSDSGINGSSDANDLER